MPAQQPLNNKQPITEELVRKVADQVYAQLLREQRLELERYRPIAHQHPNWRRRN